MAIKSIPFWQVDAFVCPGQPFSGNPAAVCLLQPEHLPVSDSEMQKIAAENNLSETAFLQATDDSASFSLRWFTPTMEVPLCGHATLAAAAVLFFEKQNSASCLTFHTLSGPLQVTRAPGEGCRLEMQLPLADPVDPLPAACPDVSAPLLRECCGDLPVRCLRYANAVSTCPQWQVQRVLFCKALKYLLVELKQGTPMSSLEGLAPDFVAMQAASREGEVTGVIVAMATGLADGPHVASRFFAPWAGITEDPVTGSAHAVLGPHFSRVLGRTRLEARQCSARSGMLTVDVLEGSVLVTGAADVVIRGTFLLPA